MKFYFAALALGMSHLSAYANTMIDAKGQKIDGEVGKIEEDGFWLKRKGNDYWVRKVTLSKESQALVEKIVQTRAEAAKKAVGHDKKQAEREASAMSAAKERVAKIAAGSLEFRGLCVGMASADIKSLFSPSGLIWEFRPEDPVNGWCSLKPEPAAKMNSEFMALATDGRGQGYEWNVVLLSFEEGTVYEMTIFSGNFTIQQFDLELKNWLTAVHKALEQKYGKPEATKLESINLLEVRRGFLTPVGVWKVNEKYRVRLTVMMDEAGNYRGQIIYSDAAISDAVQSRQKKVKSGL